MKLIFLLFLTTLSAQKTSEEVFSHIYSAGVWGSSEDGKGISGPGSTPEANKPYMEFLQNFIKDNNIKSIVDVGCGDWLFTRHLNLSGTRYTGIDVVKDVIARNQLQFSSPTVQFKYADIVQDELPCADLLICKDVLQHLPNGDVKMFLRHLPKYTHVLITNDVDPQTNTADNYDIERGGYRALDITASPFSVKGVKIFSYQSSVGYKQVIHASHP